MNVAPFRSTDIIANVSGIDAYIDGHSHYTMESEIVKDKDGKDVVLTQTGCYLKTVGVMTIHDGEISTQLVSEYNEIDEEVREEEIETIDVVNKALGKTIASLNTDMWITNPEDENERIVRRMETNLSDLVADSIYYQFNEELKQPCDVAWVTGGGVRSNIKKGDFTYMDAKTVQPFGNIICLVEASGQQIVDALEAESKTLGKVDEEGKKSEPGLLHTSGLKYTIDTSIECTATFDENGVYMKAPTGEYRVRDVQIYNRETNQYEPIDLKKTYRIGSINYLVCNGGDGLGEIFKDCKVIVDYVSEDYLTLSKYVQAFENGQIESKYSPLNKYSNFLLDYENPYGDGRITIK